MFSLFALFGIGLALRATYRHVQIHNGIKALGINGASRAITLIRVMSSQGFAIRMMTWFSVGLLLLWLPPPARPTDVVEGLTTSAVLGLLILAGVVSDVLVHVIAELLWRRAREHRKRKPDETFVMDHEEAIERRSAGEHVH